MDGQKAPRAIDFDYLRNYAAGDEALVAEVLALFAQQGAQTLAELDPAGPPATWRAAAHRLKGSALGVGAGAVGEAAAAAERAFEAPPATKAALLAKLRGALSLALAEIAARAGG